MTQSGAHRKPNRLENTLFGATRQEVPTLIPGVLLASIVVLVAAGLAEFINTGL